MAKIREFDTITEPQAILLIEADIDDFACFDMDDDTDYSRRRRA